MSAKWGVTEWRNRSVSRLEEAREWLGSHLATPPEGACPRCHGDGQPEHGRDRYCHCQAGRELLASGLELASEAALTPYDDQEKAA